MSTLLDEETVVLDALDFDVACVMDERDPAEFLICCRFCTPNCAEVCAKHLAASRRKVEQDAQLSLTGRVRCTVCGGVGGSFDELFKVVPL